MRCASRWCPCGGRAARVGSVRRPLELRASTLAAPVTGLRAGRRHLRIERLRQWSSRPAERLVGAGGRMRRSRGWSRVGRCLVQERLEIGALGALGVRRVLRGRARTLNVLVRARRGGRARERRVHDAPSSVDMMDAT